MSEEGSLTDVYRRLIASTGPISLQHYMGEANARYYTSRDPLGKGGDFVTAPEISQMFGELIGLWLADIWIRAGRTEPVHYVELGPGKGTLARDALRAMKRYGLEPVVHFVESSTALKEVQLQAVPGARFHEDLGLIPLEGPVLLVANEFLDALPVRQLVMTSQGWRERMVAWDEQKARFVCIAGERPMDAAVPEARRDAPEGALLETNPGAASVLYEAAGRLVNQGGAALFVDYGYTAPQLGSSLQAVRGHEKVDPFLDPGEADLSTLVDFDAAAQVAQSRGARWLGTMTQGEFLTALGIEGRAEALASFAPHHREALMAAKDRLVTPEQMGSLFKVMALADPDWPGGAGF